MSAKLERHLFTIDDYHQMIKTGILKKQHQVELIEGEILEMSPIGSRHASIVDRLNRSLNRQVGDSAIVRVQSPVIMNDLSEPQPDITVVRYKEDFYEQEHPQVQDIFLIIEISDTTTVYDRDIKIPVYASAGIQVVWLFDLASQIVDVYTDPVFGRYNLIQRQNKNSVLLLPSLPTIRIDLSSIFR